VRGVPWLAQERAITYGPVVVATGYARAARGLRRRCAIGGEGGKVGAAGWRCLGGGRLANFDRRDPSKRLVRHCP